MSHLPGDEYRVYYHLAGSHDTNTVDEIFDRWQTAKARRNAMFFDRSDVTVCWVMRSNSSLGMRTDKFGHTLRKDRVRA